MNQGLTPLLRRMDSILLLLMAALSGRLDFVLLLSLVSKHTSPRITNWRKSNGTLHESMQGLLLSQGQMGVITRSYFWRGQRVNLLMTLVAKIFSGIVSLNVYKQMFKNCSVSK